MQINNLAEKISAYKEQIKSATNRVIDSGWLVLGPEVKNFEDIFARYLGANYCISLANGTDAIELALKALGVDQGDTVATVANAGMYTTTAMLAIGANPFFMDVDLITRNTTLSEVKRAINAGVKAVVVTHLYGLAAPEIREISQLCKKSGVPLLEDCAQSHGASVDSQRTGTFGDASSFSFYPTKNLGALGDGGAVVTNRQDIAEKVKRLRQYGWSSKYCVEYGGARNSRLDEIQAAILAVFLPDLDAANKRRRQIAKRYSLEIKHTEITLPPIGSADYVAHLYVIQSSKRNLLQAYLNGLGISSDIHYPIPDYRQPLFKDKFAEIELKNTERLCSEILTLPCYPEMNDSLVDQVISAVNAWEI
jgi:dTDP-4-amino-4,6-dideoxygalactose transaminase